MSVASQGDFELVNTVATLTPEEFQGFSVMITNDSILEYNETFSLTLRVPESAKSLVNIEDGSSTAEITILNDDGKINPNISVINVSRDCVTCRG